LAGQGCAFKKLSFARPSQTIVRAAGMPFGTPGSTNLLRTAQID
jgi:pyruvate kinase